jgi:phage baseplate assembly protein W
MQEKQSEPPPHTSFLGTGWSFPPRFERQSGQVLMTSDEEDIEASLRILLGTSLGERFLRPKYGLNLRDLLFEPISTTMTTLFKDRIKTAILVYEPRIHLLLLEIDTSKQHEGRLQVVLDYEVRATNSRFNLVYPFFLAEGSEVRRSLEVQAKSSS